MLRRPSLGLEGLTNAGRQCGRELAAQAMRDRQAAVERAADQARRAASDNTGAKGRFR